MSSRHSFLSTTGLIRPGSAFSTDEGATHPPHTVHLGRKPAPATAPSKSLTTRAGILPLSPGFLVFLAALLSILFISCLSFAFIPDEDEKSPFADDLDYVAANAPGIVLIGDDVDVDVDEPSITIRWSIIGCGEAYVLPGSEGTHGSEKCGLPAMPLQIFVDGALEPVTSYDPATLPISSSSGKRHSIQNMFQFDDDHVLDVHEARLYPFDNYHLTSTFRAVSTADNTTVPIQKLATISVTSSFVTISSDASSTVKAANGDDEPSRDLDLDVSRPPEARMFALLLFASSWMLAHASIGLVVLSSKLDDAGKSMKNLAVACVTLLAVPQLRNAMPDAPDLDGVLIDAIGFFPQMLMCAGSAIALFCMMVKRELQDLEGHTPVDGAEETHKESPGPLSTGLMKMRRGGSSVDIRHIRNFSKSLTQFRRGA